MNTQAKAPVEVFVQADKKFATRHGANVFVGSSGPKCRAKHYLHVTVDESVSSSPGGFLRGAAERCKRLKNVVPNGKRVKARSTALSDFRGAANSPHVSVARGTSTRALSMQALRTS